MARTLMENTMAALLYIAQLGADLWKENSIGAPFYRLVYLKSSFYSNSNAFHNYQRYL